MAFFTPQKAKSLTNQPNSVLSPKPGLMQPSGNAAPSFLQPNDMAKGAGSVITPKSEQVPGESKPLPPMSALGTNTQPLSEQERAFYERATGTATQPQVINEFKQKYGANWQAEFQKALSGMNQRYLSHATPQQMQQLSQTSFNEKARGGGYNLQQLNELSRMSPEQLNNYFSTFSDPRMADYIASIATGGQRNGAKYVNSAITSRTASGHPVFGSSQPTAQGGGLQRVSDDAVVTSQAPQTTPIQSTANMANNQTPPMQRVFEYLKGQLEDQRKTLQSEARTDAASRGVFYGTPGVQAEEDVNRKYLQGLGQLEAQLLQNEQQNELARLQIASGLIPSDIMDSGGGVDPSIFSALGEIFAAPRQTAQAPVISPKTSQKSTPYVPPVSPTLTPSSTITPKKKITPPKGL